MKQSYKWLGAFLFASIVLTGCNKEENDILSEYTDSTTAAGSTKEGFFDVTFFAGNSLNGTATRVAIHDEETDRVQTLMYILYKKDETGTYAYFKHVYLFRPENYNIPEMHRWPHDTVSETLPNGDYKVVFLGNLDSNLFSGQGSTAVLSDYRSSYEDARINMPVAGPNAFNGTNMFYLDIAEFNQDSPNVDILLERIVTQHEYQREFVDTNDALNTLVGNIAANIKNEQLTTEIVGGLLHSALLEPVSDALGVSGALFATKIVDTLVGALVGDLVDALYKDLLSKLLERLESTLVTQGGQADLLGLSNLLNPWSISKYADITGKFATSVNFDLQVQSSDLNSRTWENIPINVVPGEESSKSRYISMTLLNGDKLVDKIDIKKEGLIGPVVDGVVDDDLLYGRFMNVENDLSYTASSNIKYHTNYAFLNITLDDYGTSEESEPVTVTAKLDSALVTKDLLKELLGDILGGILGDLLSPLLNAVTNVLEETTFTLGIRLPDLGIHNIVVEGGWEPTTHSSSVQ